MQPGSLFDGRFRLVRLVGAGGLGEVWLAQDVQGSTAAAVKVIRATPGDDAGYPARMRREVLLCRRLVHPHLVRFLHGGSVDGRPYLAMEFLEGRSLDAQVEALGPRPEAEARALLAQVAGAVGYLHGEGVIHRDIKPSNVMLVPGEGGPRAVLMDLGLALDPSITRLTGTSALLGTPCYLPPEVAEGKQADGRSDVFQLGALGYYLTTGHPPFEGLGLAQVLLKAAAGSVPRARALRPDLTEAWDGFLATAMAVEPAQRFPDAAAFLAALDRPTAAHAPVAVPWRPAVALAAMLVSLALALGARLLPPPSPPVAVAVPKNPSPTAPEDEVRALCALLAQHPPEDAVAGLWRRGASPLDELRRMQGSLGSGAASGGRAAVEPQRAGALTELRRRVAAHPALHACRRAVALYPERLPALQRQALRERLLRWQLVALFAAFEYGATDLLPFPWPAELAVSGRPRPGPELRSVSVLPPADAPLRFAVPLPLQNERTAARVTWRVELAGVSDACAAELEAVVRPFRNAALRVRVNRSFEGLLYDGPFFPETDAERVTRCLQVPVSALREGANEVEVSYEPVLGRLEGRTVRVYALNLRLLAR